MVVPLLVGHGELKGVFLERSPKRAIFSSQLSERTGSAMCVCMEDQLGFSQASLEARNARNGGERECGKYSNIIRRSTLQLLLVRIYQNAWPLSSNCVEKDGRLPIEVCRINRV